MSPEPAALSEAELSIHVAICEGSPEDCKDWRGRCVKAAEAVRPLLAAEALESIRERHRPHRNTGRDLSKPSIWCEGHDDEEWLTVWPCGDAALVYTEAEIEEADRV